MLIKRPHITEKTIKQAEQDNKYTFVVTENANKISASKELADTFGVTIINVTSNNRLGKEKSFGRTRRKVGKRQDMKLMVFTLKAGDKIDLFSIK